MGDPTTVPTPDENLSRCNGSRLAAVLTIALAGVALAFLFESRSLHRAADERSSDLRIDQADMLFNVQLGMTEERLQLRKVSAHIDAVLRRTDEDERRGDELRRVIEWDFNYDSKADLKTIRREIRSCLDPIQWLGNCFGPSYWNWEVKQQVNFFEQKQQGEIIVTAVYRSTEP